VRIHIACSSFLALLAASESARAQYFLVPDITGDQIMLINRSDGSIANAFFISDDPNGTNYDFKNPWEAIQVGAEIWVTDFTSDQLIRFGPTGNWLSTVATGIDNPRGMALASNGLVYVCNSGSAHMAPGAAIIAFNAQAVPQFHFAVSTAADVIDRNGELLVSNLVTHDLERYSYAGVFLGTFHASDGVSGINAPAQIAPGSGGHILAAGNGGSVNYGLYRYSSAGLQTDFWHFGTAPLGIAELNTGDVLYTDATGLHIYSISGMTSSDVQVGFGGTYINPFTPPAPPVVYCTSGTTTHGCVPQMSALGNPSASLGSGFTINVNLTEGQKQGLIFYGISGQFIQPWATGSNSFLCVKLPLQRTNTTNSGGAINTCNGTFSLDWNAYIAANPGALGQPFAAGIVVDAQGWFRDPTAAKTTNLTAGIEFTVQP
jgi:hypothetical protein